MRHSETNKLTVGADAHIRPNAGRIKRADVGIRPYERSEKTPPSEEGGYSLGIPILRIRARRNWAHRPVKAPAAMPVTHRTGK